MTAKQYIRQIEKHKLANRAALKRIERLKLSQVVIRQIRPQRGDILVIVRKELNQKIASHIRKEMDPILKKIGIHSIVHDWRTRVRLARKDSPHVTPKKT
ncbi:MAG: hypothetical protein A2Y38_23345 [Spirochaetes bacterium GWB1_59_5]|nr:MAG: hypothetical protein A2Y38_23345 [Spirochaetes bacterium GWB1_59_5]